MGPTAAGAPASLESRRVDESLPLPHPAALAAVRGEEIEDTEQGNDSEPEQELISGHRRRQNAHHGGAEAEPSTADGASSCLMRSSATWARACQNPTWPASWIFRSLRSRTSATKASESCVGCLGSATTVGVGNICVGCVGNGVGAASSAVSSGTNTSQRYPPCI